MQQVACCRKRVENFPGGELGTGTGPAERQKSLENALERVEYRRNCSPGLTQCRQNGRPAPRDRPNCRQCPLRARDKIEFYNKRRRGFL